MKRWLLELARRLLQPRMLYGYRHADGRWLAHTRVSTHTRIEHPHSLDMGDHVFVGHFTMMAAWWVWLWTGYGGVAATLEAYA